MPKFTTDAKSSAAFICSKAESKDVEVGFLLQKQA